MSHQKRDKKGRYGPSQKKEGAHSSLPALNPKNIGITMAKTPSVKDLQKLGAPAAFILVGNRAAAKLSAWGVGRFMPTATAQTKTLVETGLSLLAALVTYGMGKGNPNIKLAALGMTTAGIESALGLFGEIPLLSGFRQSQLATALPAERLLAPPQAALADPVTNGLASATGPKSPVYRNPEVGLVESAY